MAEAPKSTKKDKADATKASTSDSPAKTTKDAKGPVEDAEVIGETPPKATSTTAADATASAKDTPKDAKTEPADAKAETDPKPAAKPAQPVTSSRKAPPADSAAKPVEKPAPKPAEPKAETARTDKPAAPETKPTPAEKVKEPPRRPPEPKRGGAGSFVGLLLGGVAAAVIGFVAARTVVPEGWPFPGVPPEEDPLAAAVETQGAALTAIGDRLNALDATLEEVKSDTSAIDALRDSVATRLDGLETGALEIADRLDAMDTRLSSVEKLAPEGTAAAEMAAEAYAKELAQLREMFQGELDEIDAAQAEASALEAQLAETAKAASGRAALARVEAALDTGEPFETALADLTGATGVDAPPALSAVAADGVPTLAELQAAFPEVARAAIEADIRTSVEDGSMNRMQAFLQTQLGTRSLEPKEGDSADAVLSRAEAALKTGDLSTVLAEIDTLPEASKPAFADWRAQTETRAAALAAGAALADELNAK